MNRRLEQLQAGLREADLQTTGRFLFQSLVVTVSVGEALNDYLKEVGDYAKRRHGELKQTNDELGARHAELLKSGKELLEQLKANPTDRAIRKEIERAQQAMESIQKNVRRNANALQRDVAPSVAAIDAISESVRRFGDAEDNDTLKRLLKTVVEQVRELYATHPDLPAKDIVDAVGWEKSAAVEIDQAAGFYDSYARAGANVILALELMALAVSPTPPSTAQDAAWRANESVGVRLKAVTARFAGEQDGQSASEGSR